ncbi:MAG TPA: alkaline phosphatase family protein [Candidatus Eremiobacteraceae bacterium]|jgi:phospholipase C
MDAAEDEERAMKPDSVRATTVCAIIASACVAAACGAGGGGTATPSLPLGRPSPLPSASAGPLPSPSVNPALKIQHVVIIVQENRSFDNMFNGFPGADTAQSGKMSNGQTVQLTSIHLDQGYDLRHRHFTWWMSWDQGKMDGFDIDRSPGNSPTFPYQYVSNSDTQPYWDLASHYTIADDMFQSNTSGSYPAHLYLFSAQSDDISGNPTALPWGCDAPPGTKVSLVGPNGTEQPGPFPCFSWPTLADNMNSQGMSWRYYSPQILTSGGIWNTPDSFSKIRYGPDWTRNVVSPETQVLNDIPAGQLAQVTWIVPSGANSDHPGSQSKTGPSWVASIVNAIGASPFWSSTAIFVTWDDWGGWYDHVNPPQLDEMGLSFRVPLLVISPYARHGYVSHVQHEFGSILHFTEENFGMPSLGRSDARADDLLDCFDFSQTPAPFVRIPAPLSAQWLVAHTHNSAPDSDF